jgi:ketosteroid isomerase-like protein
MQRELEFRFRYTMRFVLVLAVALIGVAGCSRPPDQAAIRDTIESMRRAAEARDAGGVLDSIAPDFSGRGGELDREGLSRLLKLEFLRPEPIGVSIGSVEIAVDGDRATAKFEMTLTDRSRRFLPGGSEDYSVISGWRREGRHWVCVNATWDAKE